MPTLADDIANTTHIARTATRAKYPWLWMVIKAVFPVLVQIIIHSFLAAQKGVSAGTRLDPMRDEYLPEVRAAINEVYGR